MLPLALALGGLALILSVFNLGISIYTLILVKTARPQVVDRSSPRESKTQAREIFRGPGQRVTEPGEDDMGMPEVYDPAVESGDGPEFFDNII